jgi:hypothetical protein
VAESHTLPLFHVLPCFAILMLFLLYLLINRRTYYTHTKLDFRNFCCHELNTLLSLRLMFRFPHAINLNSVVFPFILCFILQTILFY